MIQYLFNRHAYKFHAFMYKKTLYISQNLALVNREIFYYYYYLRTILIKLTWTVLTKSSAEQEQVVMI